MRNSTSVMPILHRTTFLSLIAMNCASSISNMPLSYRQASWVLSYIHRGDRRQALCGRYQTECHSLNRVTSKPWTWSLTTFVYGIVLLLVSKQLSATDVMRYWLLVFFPFFRTALWLNRSFQSPRLFSLPSLPGVDAKSSKLTSLVA